MAAYIDNVIVFSNDWQYHLEDLRAILGDLRAAGLTANPRKWNLGQKETKCLGFRVGQGHVRPVVDKVEVLWAYVRPQNKKQVRLFVALANYYCKFIPWFSEMIAPLTDLTKGKQCQGMKWTREVQEEFEKVKKTLCGEPVLFMPD